jgi:hypothetical protein
VPLVPELIVKDYDSFEHRSLSPESSDKYDYSVKKNTRKNNLKQINILSDVIIQGSSVSL